MNDQLNILLRPTVTFNPKVVELAPTEIAGRVVGGDGMLVEFFRLPRSYEKVLITVKDLDEHRRELMEYGCLSWDNLEELNLSSKESSDDVTEVSRPQPVLLTASAAGVLSLAPTLYLIWAAAEASKSLRGIASEIRTCKPLRWLNAHLP